MRLKHSSSAAAAGSPINPLFRRALELVKEEELAGLVGKIAVPRHFKSNAKANREVAEWVFSQLVSCGYEAHFQGAYSNIIAVNPNLKSNSLILIGAHYDSVPHCPGADDNASAVAALLACARIISDLALPVPICFAAFNCEEDGLLGSRDFVHSYLPEAKIMIDQVHVLEMLGYSTGEPDSQSLPARLPIKAPTVGNFLGIMGNGDSRGLIDDLLGLSKTYLPELPVLGLKLYLGVENLLPDLGRSDHLPFWEKKIPALMWTDTAEFRNPNYHRTTDTPETLNYSFLKKITQLLLLQILSYQSKLG